MKWVVLSGWWSQDLSDCSVGFVLSCWGSVNGVISSRVGGIRLYMVGV